MIQDLQTKAMRADGHDYVLTLGTGEVSYGDDGECAFAYDAEEFRGVSERVASYSDLCDRLSPVSDEDELRRIAVVAAARHGYRVTIGGACTPVLSDEEYDLVRAAVAAMAD